MKHYTELLLLEEHIVGRIYECFQAKIADCSSSLGAGTQFAEHRIVPAKSRG